MAATDTAIKNAKPKDKAYKLADEKGLHLLVHPSGGLLWPMNCRVAGSDDKGQRKRIEKLPSFGSYPVENAAAKRRAHASYTKKSLAHGIQCIVTTALRFQAA